MSDATWYVVLHPKPHNQWEVNTLVVAGPGAQTSASISEAHALTMEEARPIAASCRDLVSWSVMIVDRAQMERLFIEREICD